ncbi:MAG TPA: amino acid ABC transporter permease [Bosea sp. (in: a-proteobacteria)]|uniref:amino acid ABC transporter permease n=1 Tax=Bosea sp. (in: a-proteobacteria) TaxID=1871050 RepID=UPI002E108AA5|nr:amino acid ABC transporter permease [Bosea sp. (in: a-proteobacteria)]
MSADPAYASATALPIIRRRHWGSWVLGGLAVAAVAAIIWGGVRSRILDLEVIGAYLFHPAIVAGAFNALVLGTLALAISSVIGLVTALMRLSGNPILVALSSTYVYLFRGTPMLIQLVFWFNAVPTMFPTITISLPFLPGPLFETPTTVVVTPFLAALAGLSLAEGAYMSEIMRSGITAIDSGQRAAATALGMTKRQVFAQIVAPQAGRIIVPACGNQYIMLLKSTSLASTIGYPEMLRVVTDIYSSNFRVVELLAVAAIWYLALTAVATAVQTALEKRFPPR